MLCRFLVCVFGLNAPGAPVSPDVLPRAGLLLALSSSLVIEHGGDRFDSGPNLQIGEIHFEDF